jgi:cytochrome c-type biogenesis protein CcmH
MIWLVFLLLFIPVVFLLKRGGDQDDSDWGAASHYRGQLAEIDADRKNGRLDKSEAVAARLEIERRILRLAENRDSRFADGSKGSLSPLVLALVFMAAAFLLYQQMGSPAVSSKVAHVSGLLDTEVTQDGPSYREAILKIEQHLSENPEDVEGWEVLAKSSRAVRQFSKTAKAFGMLADLEPRNVNWRVQQLDAFLAMGAGQISPAAKLVIKRILQQEPSHPAGHYYLGLSHQQAGDEAAARAVWMALADRSQMNAPWMSSLKERLAEVGVGVPKLTQEDQQMVAAMSAQERDAFVRSMIDRLQARLESAPDDAEGWMMLARSQAALGEKDTAIASLTRAIGLVSEEDKPALQAFLDNLKQ